MKHQITISIDDDALPGYTDERLAVFWHVAQANPADITDQSAGELAERVGREIIRRWLRPIPPALWNHQGRHHYQLELSRLADASGNAGTIMISREDLQAVTRALADHEWSDFADAPTEAAYHRLAAEAETS